MKIGGPAFLPGRLEPTIFLASAVWQPLPFLKVIQNLRFRFNVDMSEFPMINRIMENLEPLDAFVKAHPDQQPDKQ